MFQDLGLDHFFESDSARYSRLGKKDCGSGEMRVSSVYPRCPTSGLRLICIHILGYIRRILAMCRVTSCLCNTCVYLRIDRSSPSLAVYIGTLPLLCSSTAPVWPPRSGPDRSAASSSVSFVYVMTIPLSNPSFLSGHSRSDPDRLDTSSRFATTRHIRRICTSRIRPLISRRRV